MAELLAPAGNFKTALAAFAAGADAVYCGLGDFSARAFAENFSPEDLRQLLRFARDGAADRKVYVTFNTLVDEGDAETAIERLSELDALRPDALIVQDLGVARLCRKYFHGLELHASTQLVAHNLEGVLALGELGFRRVVLARELSLREITSIAKRCGDIELECFIHGALCYSVSGLCLFSAMEKDRSGNRGKCAYCCRLPYSDAEGRNLLAYSMKDLRLAEDVGRLAEAGVKSLKIEGRMKSDLYVASVTGYYRRLLDGDAASLSRPRVTQADLETVFSRRTTRLYFDGRGASPVDSVSLGHLGAPIGVVKRVTRDREGRYWLRFHTARALERHDGLQFEAPDGGKPLGMGISQMREAISRRPVFEVGAGTDVEIQLLPSEAALAAATAERPAVPELAAQLKSGMNVYCSMSNAVRRMFPAPSFRPSDYAGAMPLDLTVTLDAGRITVRAAEPEVEVALDGPFDGAKTPERTPDAVRQAFSKLGGTEFRLRQLEVVDPERRFVPMSTLNDLRRDLVERLDDVLSARRRTVLEAALADEEAPGEAPTQAACPSRVVKLRAGGRLPPGDWDEVVVVVDAETDAASLLVATDAPIESERLRLALPVYTGELDFNRLRVVVKGFVRRGYVRWEASDLATLRLLKAAGVSDITADWTLYAFNLSALRQLTALGVRRFVASPENGGENLRFLAESGYPVEFLRQQSTPLFISLTRPEGGEGDVLMLKGADGREVVSYRRGGLWVTTRPVPRTFPVPNGRPERLDLSWDMP